MKSASKLEIYSQQKAVPLYKAT